jgi:hypothetical protein
MSTGNGKAPDASKRHVKPPAAPSRPLRPADRALLASDAFRLGQRAGIPVSREIARIVVPLIKPGFAEPEEPGEKPRREPAARCPAARVRRDRPTIRGT